MASNKTAIVERVFKSLWDDGTQSLTRSVVTFDDIQTAISQDNQNNPERRAVSGANPANFWKDFTRRRHSANLWWPSVIFQRGYTGRQLTGERRSFEFVPILPGQTEPFPESIPGPTEQTPRHQITSAVLPLASRRLGRNDEPWLFQVVVRLRVVEAHLSFFSPRRAGIRQIDHLQNSVKLRLSEIDAIYLAVEELPDGSLHEFIITCEVKQRGEDITMEQLVRQPKAAFTLRGVTQDMVVPLVIRTTAASEVHVIEFVAVSREGCDELTQLQLVSEAVYSLCPPVPGIGG